MPDGFNPATHYIPESATANTPFAGIPVKQICGCPDGPRHWSLTGADFDEAELTPTGWTTRDFLEAATGTPLPGGLTPEDVRPPQAGSVNLAIGEFVARFTILEIPTHRGPDFEFTLTHRSIGYADGNRHLGPHWDASFLRYIEWAGTPGSSNLLLNTGDARVEQYTLVTFGVWDGPPGTFSQILLNGATGNYELTDKVGNRLVFMPPTTAPGGYVLRMEDSAGQGFAFSYAAYPARIDVTDAHGRTIRLHFNAALVNPGGTLILDRIEDVAAAREVRLFHGGGAPFTLDLVETPQGAGTWTTTQFVYGGFPLPLVSEILDNRGIQYLRNDYDATGRVTAQHLATGQTWEFRYQYPFGTTQVIDPRGSVEEWTFHPTLRSMPVKRVELPNTFLRQDDPRSYTTFYEPNTLLEFSRVAFPRGNFVEFQWKGLGSPTQPLTAHGDLMRIRKDPGPVQSPSESGPGAVGPVGSVNRGAMEFRFESHVLHQPINVVDPRGLQTGYMPPNGGAASISRYRTEFGYGGAGAKLSSILHPAVNPFGLPAPSTPAFTTAYSSQTSLQSFDYNAAGQLIRHTDPLGKQHTRTYHASAGVPRNGYLSALTVDSTGLGLTTSHTYDAMGNVASVTDPDGNTWTHDYDLRCNLVQSHAPAPFLYETLFGFDGNDNLESMQQQKDAGSPDYTLKQFAYDEYDRLWLARTDASLPPAPPGATILEERFVYDPNGNLVYHATPAGEDEAFRYDARNLPFERVVFDNMGHDAVESFWYDANGNARVTRDALGNETWSWYDGFDRLGFAVDPLGTVRNNVYDPVGNVLFVEVRAPEAPVPTGPGQGAVTDAQAIQKFSDATRRMSLDMQYHDEKNHQYRLDRQHIIHDADAAPLRAPTGGTLTPGDDLVTTAWQPDPIGQIVRSVDDKIGIASFLWDGAGRLVQEQDAVGNQVKYTYDGRGNVVSTVTTEVNDAGAVVGSFSQAQSFDEAGRLESATDTTGDTVLYEYDGRDNLVNTTDRVGNFVEHEYDDGDRLASTVFTDAANSGAAVTIVQVLDGDGRVMKRCDGAGGCTDYEYDTVRNLLKKEQHPDGVTLEYEYDDNGRLVQTRDNRGRTMLYTRDARGDVTTVAVDDPFSSGTKTQTFKRDALGRVTLFTDDGLVQFQQTAALGPIVSTLGYDSLGRVVSELQRVGSASMAPVVYVRDGVGDTVQTVYPNGRIVDRSFDALGRVQQMSDSKGLIAQYDYEGPGRVVERRGGGVRTAIDHDADRRVQRIEHRDTASSVLHLGAQYHYDAADRPVAAVNLRSGILSERYESDHLGRLDLWDRGSLDPSLNIVSHPCNGLVSTWAFTLDDAGNWDSHVRETRDASCAVSSDTYGRMHSAANEATFESHPSTPAGFACKAGPGADQCNYDLEGALINDGERRYEHDFLKRVVQVTDDSGQPLVYYGYDALGRKVARAELEDGNLRDLHFFTYSSWNVMEQTRLLGDVVPLDPEFRTVRQWTWGPGLDEPVEMSVDSNDDASTTGTVDARYHYHLDAQGSVMGLTELFGGGARLVEGYIYEAYGTPTAFRPGPNGVVDWGGDDEVRHSTVSGLGNPLLYQGMWWEDLGRDIDVELYYARARHLHPDLGRFVSRDPSGVWSDPVSMGNAYMFAGDNPTAFRDPTGAYSIVAPVRCEQLLCWDQWGVGGEMWGSGREQGRETDETPRDAPPMSVPLGPMGGVTPRTQYSKCADAKRAFEGQRSELDRQIDGMKRVTVPENRHTWSNGAGPHDEQLIKAFQGAGRVLEEVFRLCPEGDQRSAFEQYEARLTDARGALEEYYRRNPERPRQWLSGRESPGVGTTPLAPYGAPLLAPRPAHGYVPVGLVPLPGTRAYVFIPVLVPVPIENPAASGVVL